MTTYAIAYKPGDQSSPAFVAECSNVQEAYYALCDNTNHDWMKYIDIRVHDFVTRFAFDHFTRPENYQPQL